MPPDKGIKMNNNPFFIRKIRAGWFVYCGPNGREVSDHDFETAGYLPNADREGAILLAHSYSNWSHRTVIECSNNPQPYVDQRYPDSLVSVFKIDNLYYVMFGITRSRSQTTLYYSSDRVKRGASHITPNRTEALLKAHDLAAEWDAEHGVFFYGDLAEDSYARLPQDLCDEDECWAPKECGCPTCRSSLSQDDYSRESYLLIEESLLDDDIFDLEEEYDELYR